MTSLLTGIAALIFAFLCVQALYRPYWASVLLLTYVAYEQLLSSYISGVSRNSWLINAIAAVVAAISVLISMLYKKKPLAGYFNINTMLVACLYAFAIFGVTYSMLPAAGIYFIKKGIPSAIVMLILLPALINDFEHLRKMAVPLMLIGCSLICLILVSPRTEIYGSRLFIDLSYTMGAKSRGNPLALGELGGLMILFAALVEPHRAKLLLNLLRTASVLLGVSIAFLVGSRGQLIFAIFFVVMLYPLAHRVRNIRQFFLRAGSLGGFALVMVVVAKVFLAGSKSVDRYSAQDIAMGFQGRVYFAKTLLAEYASSPSSYLQGLGTGSFNAVVKFDADGYLYPHNLIVEVLAHHGIIGLSILLGIFIVTGVHMLKVFKLARQGLIDRSAAAIILALVSYTTFLSMKQGSFVMIPIPFYSYLILSKLVTLANREQLVVEEWYDSNEYEDPIEEYTYAS